MSVFRLSHSLDLVSSAEGCSEFSEDSNPPSSFGLDYPSILGFERTACLRSALTLDLCLPAVALTLRKQVFFFLLFCFLLLTDLPGL